MDVFDYCRKCIGIRVWLDTMSEIEDVSGMSSVVRKDSVRGGECSVDVAEHCSRIHVSLHDEIVAESTSCIADRRPPIQAEYITSRFVDCFEEMIATNAEVNPRDMWEPIVQLTKDPCGVRENE